MQLLETIERGLGLKWLYDRLKGLATFGLLELLSRIAIVVAVVFWFMEADDRKAGEQLRSWELINSTVGKPGDLGRSIAVKRLVDDDVDLINVNLSKADIKGIQIPRVNFEGANLAGTNLKGANLKEAKLNGADLRGANLEGTDLLAADLDGADLTGARYNDETKWPDGFDKDTLQKANHEGVAPPMGQPQSVGKIEELPGLVERERPVQPVPRVPDDSSPRPVTTGDASEQIKTLMRRAVVQLKNGNVFSPPGDNACESYRQVVELDPGNKQARQLMGVARCREAKAEMEQLLAQAEDQFKRQKLTAPKGDNAYETYKKILELEPGNQTALEGLTRIADRYQGLAEQPGQPVGKRWEYVTQGLVARPDHTGLLALREELTPDVVGYLLKRGWDSLSGFYWDTAISSFKLVMELDPENEEAQRGLVSAGNLLVQFPRNYEGAYEQYRYVLEINPSNEAARQGLQGLLVHYQKRLEQSPDDQSIAAMIKKIMEVLQTSAPTEAAGEVFER